MKYQDIHGMYKAGVALVAFTVFILGYHNKYITKAEASDFVTKTEMTVIVGRLDSIDGKLDGMVASDSRGWAYDTIKNIEGDIKRHNQLTNDNPAWSQLSEKYDGELERAISYKDCVVDGRSNCGNIKERIWQ